VAQLQPHGRVLARHPANAAPWHHREELWSGNRESLRMALFSKESILLWSFTTFAGNRVKYAAARESGDHPHLRWHELRARARHGAS
jgi:hypothetical protein